MEDIFADRNLSIYNMYLDDSIVFLMPFENNLKRMDRVLQRIKKFGIETVYKQVSIFPD